MYFDRRLWEMTAGLRLRMALAVGIGLVAIAVGILRFAFLGRVLDGSKRDEALRALRESNNVPAEALLAQLNNPRVELRFAAARALGEVCRPEVVEVLWRMVARDVHRREALAALTQCHDPRAGRYLAIVNDDPRLESQLRSVREQMKQYF